MRFTAASGDCSLRPGRLLLRNRAFLTPAVAATDVWELRPVRTDLGSIAKARQSWKQVKDFAGERCMLHRFGAPSTETESERTKLEGERMTERAQGDKQ